MSERLIATRAHCRFSLTTAEILYRFPIIHPLRASSCRNTMCHPRSHG